MGTGWHLRLAATLLALLLGGCAAPAPAGPPARPPTADPSPAPVLAPGQPDRSCRTDADCTVKNVGNCCGAMPACVHRDSQVDPAAVQAQCAKEGRMSVCGFQAISGCRCEAGQCVDIPEQLEGVIQPVPLETR